MKVVKFQGGLGNQMFQYGFFLALKKTDPHVCAQLTSLRDHNGYELNKIFGIQLPIFWLSHFKLFSQRFPMPLVRKSLEKIHMMYHRTTASGVYESSLLEEKMPYLSICLYDGYWQTEKYFKHIADQVRIAFTFPTLTDTQNLSVLEKIKQAPATSIHVRRGDYLQHGAHFSDEATKIYYGDSIALVLQREPKTNFVIFSDDIPWCKENLPLKDLAANRIIFVDWNKGENSYKDMQLMSLCQHNIIANSSFSWWGAWLNSSAQKIVCAPERWFHGENNYSYKDMIPEDWVQVKNY